MKIKTIFTINCIIAFLFGAGFIFLPTLCLSLMGYNVAGDSKLIAQGMGVFVFGTGVLTFLAKNTPKSEARRAIALSMIILYILLISYKVSLNLYFGIPFNLMFAAIYVIHIALIASYVYVLFKEAVENRK
ncbi:hypothetical protein ACFLRY_00655 [Bacteroidota bacterium]